MKYKEQRLISRSFMVEQKDWAHLQMIEKLSEALEGSQRTGATRYICFNPYKKEFVIKHNSDVVKNNCEISHYIGRAPNSELDYERIVDQINGAYIGKFGITIFEVKDEFISRAYGFISDEQITKEYGE